MRRMIITKENRDSFATMDDTTSVLKAIDKLLHDRDLELVVGDEGGSSDLLIKIGKCREDEEYNINRTQTVLYGRGKGMFDKFEI